MDATGIKNLVSCWVDHCQGAQAVTVRFHTGFGFSYSGDCRPSGEFVRIGRGSTVLVHEATFDDEMEGDAKAKKHSTMSEAIGVASAMGAKRLILTHFSQRYQKLPNLGALDNVETKLDNPQPSEDGPKGASAELDVQDWGPPVGVDDQFPTPPTNGRKSSFSSPNSSPPLSPTKHELKIAIAFDFLRVRVGDIAYIERFTPTLQRLFEILEQNEKAKAQDNPGEVARRKKDEQKQEKRKNQRRTAREKEEAKAIRRDGFRRLSEATAKNEGRDDVGAADSLQDTEGGTIQPKDSNHECVGEVEHLDRTGIVSEEVEIVHRPSTPLRTLSHSPVQQHTAS